MQMSSYGLLAGAGGITALALALIVLARTRQLT
jgi:hypothetical protein